MKNFIILLTLLLCYLVTLSPAEAQYDAKLYIGGAYLRYDYDSAKLRLGKLTGASIIKLAREEDAQFFDFNSSHFTWSTTTGLNLAAPYSTDSLYSKIFCVYRDTGDGETIPYEVRSYRFKKPVFANNYGNWDLKLIYQHDSSGANVTKDTAYVVNSSVATVVAEYGALATEPTAITAITLPQKGTWFVQFEYDYEFENVASTTRTYDSIHLVLYYNLDSVYNTHKFAHPGSDAEAGFRGSASLSCIVTTTTANQDVVFAGMCSQSDSPARYLNQYRKHAILLR